jgi:anti-sigma B factor antagonist
MEIKETTESSLLVLVVSGEIDLNHSPALRVVLRDKAKAKTPQLLLDFTSVAYIDSSGLATLIEYYQSARSFSGKFALCSLSSRVRSSFDLMRLSEVFSIFADQAAAQKFLTGGTP